MLTRLAGAVADGESVDWEAAELNLPEGRRPVLRALRSLAARSGETLVSDRSASGVEARAAPAWLWALVGAGSVHVLLGLVGAAWDTPAAGPVPRAWSGLGALAFAGAAAWLLVGGRADPRARYLGSVFFTLASSLSFPLASGLVTALPQASRPWWNAVSVEAFLPLCLWCFVREFPRVLHMGRTELALRVGIAVSAGVGGALFAVQLLRTLGPPALASAAPWLYMLDRGDPSFAFWGLLLGLTLLALAVGLLRTREAPESERRRVRRFALALALGLGPIFLEVLLEALLPPFRALMSEPRWQRAGALLLFPPLLATPFLTAHAILADRLLDVRVLLDRVTRYLIARTTLWLLTALPLIALAVHLYGRRAESLESVLSGDEGRALVAAAAIGAALLFSRRALEARLSRAFSRSTPDWRRLRRSLNALLRRGQPLRETAVDAVDEIAAVLGCERASLLVPAHGSRWLTALAGEARPLASDSALGRLAAADPGPLLTDPTHPHSVFRLLPHEDRAWIVDTRTALLLPVGDTEAAGCALLAVAPRTSGVRYTREERSELADVCQTLALALEAVSPEPKPADERDRAFAQSLPATECTDCHRVCPTDRVRCECGKALVAAPLPYLLFGKFELQERLGRGGMGLVYRALDRELERSVALKTLPRVSEQDAERLRREARAMAALSHAGVASIFGVDRWHGLPILVVEYLPRGTLAERLGRPWPVGDVLALGTRLAEALAAVHRRGLLHRDIKPSNVGFDAEDRPKLLDFGLAQLVRAAPRRGDAWAEPAPRALAESQAKTALTRGVAGTPLYLCPEAFDSGDGEAPGPYQDLWSLTLVLYELVAGFHPFRAGRVEETLARIRLARLPDPRERAPECPEAVAAFFERALHRNPGRRPDSATALLEELEGLSARVGTTAAASADATAARPSSVADTRGA